MSETNGNGSNGNGNGANGANGWMKTVLVALATLALGGGVGATTLRDAPQSITPGEVTAMKVFEAETKLRLNGHDKKDEAHDKAFEAINTKLDALMDMKGKKQ